MESFKQHEQFEMEVLRKLSDAGLLTHLIFGGGTCLRLCFGMPRYSIDLDFWSAPGFNSVHFKKMKRILAKAYETTDSASKFYSHLLELRSPLYPHKLKIEIRKKPSARPETERSIAYSFFSNLQVQLTTLTLRQMGKNKVQALLDRREVRDAYDLEFIYKKGAFDLKSISKKFQQALLKVLKTFSRQDFKVKLGSLLGPEERNYYNLKGFALLLNALK